MKLKSFKGIVKTWIVHFFKIPVWYRVFYETTDGRKIAVFVEANRKDGSTKTYRFLVEHLLDENFEVTLQILKQERELFFSITQDEALMKELSSNK